MKKASISQTKNQLSALLEQVRHGETVLITDRGRPVARLEPAVVVASREQPGRLARLERTGIIRRTAATAANQLLLKPPPKTKNGASALSFLLEERAQGR